MRIVFMGTPYFAVGVLEHLINCGRNVVGVVTAVDKPAGRGKKMHQSAVKQFAVAHHLNLMQPKNLKSQDFKEVLEQLKPDVIIVVAFRMLPEQIWRLPKHGTFNLHASLLPQYRGAAPINWAIINGETKTGVTTFFIDDKIDTGSVLLQKEVDITNEETAGSLHDKLLEVGKHLVEQTLKGIAEHSLMPKPQNTTHWSMAPKLTKDNTKIDWSKQGQDIENLIRGLSPYPVAWTYFKNEAKKESLKIYDAKYEQTKHDKVVGTIVATKKTVSVAVADGWVHLKNIQYPSKKKMAIADFLNGYTFNDNAMVI